MKNTDEEDFNSSNSRSAERLLVHKGAITTKILWEYFSASFNSNPIPAGQSNITTSYNAETSSIKIHSPNPTQYPNF